MEEFLKGEREIPETARRETTLLGRVGGKLG